jgi:hypothetical protein
VYNGDDGFAALYPSVQNAIRQFNMGERIDDSAIMRLTAQHRELIRKTYLAATGQV